MTTKRSFESSPQDAPTNENEGLIRRPFTPGRPFSAEDEARLDALADKSDEDIDYSDIPPLPNDFFKNAVRGWLPMEMRTISVPLDAEVYDWILREGPKNARVINHVLRREMQQSAAHEGQAVPAPPASPTMSKAS